MTNKEITVIEKKLLPTIEEVKSLEVKNEKTEREAAEMLSQLNLIGDRMKEAKAKVYDPAWKTVVAIREEWKPKETMLETAIQMIRGKMNAYRTEAKRLADAEAAKIAARVGEGKGKLKVETAVRKMEEIEQPTGAVATDAGVVKYKEVQKCEIVNLKLLASERLDMILPNEILIRKAMLKGEQLPGVRYYTEQVPVNFR